jgi:hypothetical protein
MAEIFKKTKEQEAESRLNSLIGALYSDWEAIIAIGLLLFLLFLPFQLVVKQIIPDPFGTYWKEAILVIMIVIWGIGCLLTKRPLLSYWPLDIAVLLYLGLLILRIALDRSGWVGAWGLYISVMYLPLYWLIPAVLRRYPNTTITWIALIVGVGGFIALGGLLEFILNIPLWPSAEMVQRQGFPDVYIYGTHLRRVYFVFDSPTTLANTLALILPLALVLIWLARSKWMKWAAGISAALIAACIIVTFSRGIWVATLISIIFMELLIGLTLKKPRIIYTTLGVVIMISLLFGGILLSRASQAAKADQGIVELNPDMYRKLPVTGASQDLLQVKPDYGESVIKSWSIQDPITLQADKRAVLFEDPSGTGKKEIIYRITVPEGGALRFAIAISPEVWSPEKGNGAQFEVFVTPPGNPAAGKFIFSRYINPKLNPSDRRWRNFLVDLSPWAGQTINLSVISEQGPENDSTFDWAGWSDLQIVSLPVEYFSSRPGGNTVWRHISSIWDWVGDETNRDRLAAWSTAFNNWRAAPLWGKGLGTTGVAAFHTQPEIAFVTESQILKSLTELGVLGLLSLLFLWFQIARTSYISYRKSAGRDDDKRILLLGIMTSLLIIFIEGFVYQNLEVKQVNAYFWTLTGILAFLAGNLNHEANSRNHNRKLESPELPGELLGSDKSTNISKP